MEEQASGADLAVPSSPHSLMSEPVPDIATADLPGGDADVHAGDDEGVAAPLSPVAGAGGSDAPASATGTLDGSGTLDSWAGLPPLRPTARDLPPGDAAAAGAGDDAAADSVDPSDI